MKYAACSFLILTLMACSSLKDRGRVEYEPPAIRTENCLEVLEQAGESEKAGPIDVVCEVRTLEIGFQSITLNKKLELTLDKETSR